MCGDAGVSLLDGFLNGRSLFGKRGDPELRACAATRVRQDRFHGSSRVAAQVGR